MIEVGFMLDCCCCRFDVVAGLLLSSIHVGVYSSVERWDSSLKNIKRKKNVSQSRQRIVQQIPNSLEICPSRLQEKQRLTFVGQSRTKWPTSLQL